MQVGIDLRHAAATGLPPIPISSSTGQSSAKALGLGNVDGDNYKLPNGCTEPFIPQTRPNPLADNALRRQNFEAGGPDDPSTWGDIGAYEVKATGVRFYSMSGLVIIDPLFIPPHLPSSR